MNTVEAHEEFSRQLLEQYERWREGGCIDLTGGVVDVRDELCPTSGQPLDQEEDVHA